MPVRLRFIHDEVPDAAWRDFSRRKPEDFYRDMTSGLPQGTEVICTIFRARQEITLRHPAFTFTRFIVGGDVAYHNNGDITAAKRGQGIAQAVNRNMMSWYAEKNIERIRLVTDNVGTYLWARAGFVPDAAEWKHLRRSLSRRLDFLEAHPPQDGPLPDGCVKKLRALLRDDDPKSYWAVVDQTQPVYGLPVGRALTMYWTPSDMRADFPFNAEAEKLEEMPGYHGELDFADAAAMARFRTFLDKYTPAPAARPRPPRGPRA